MKNISIKVILLLAVALGVIAGVMLFMKKLAAPPYEVQNANPYVAHVNELITSSVNAEGGSKSMKANLDLIDNFYREKKIDIGDYNQLYEKVARPYMQDFVNRTFNFFRQSSWPERSLKNIQRERLDFLSIKRMDGDVVANLMPDIATDLKKIDKIISDYRKALALSKSATFQGWDDAKRRIDQARTFLRTDPFDNNAKLVEGLNQLPSRLCKSHYSQLEAKIKKLKNIRSVIGFDAEYTRLVKEIDKFHNWSGYGINGVSNMQRLLNKSLKDIEFQGDFNFSMPDNSTEEVWF